MPIFQRQWLLGVLMIAAAASCGRAEEPITRGTDSQSVANSSRGVAVVELFSSEGCNSCPPADDNLADLVRQHATTGQPIYALVFHVDYWDALGWKDRFATPGYTRRQRGYANIMGTDSVYTPQAVVNGTADVVGSRAKELTAAVATALETPATATVTLTALPDTERPAGPLALGYNVTGAGSSDVLNIALVEGDLSTAVKRGENAGRTLRHENVVRAFQTVRLGETAQGRVTVELPDGVRADHARVIGYVQNAKTGQVSGAAELAHVAGR